MSERHQRKIAWLNERTSAYFALEPVVRDKILLNVLKHLTKIQSHSTVYYALCNKYSPKRLQFSWNGMVAVTELANLDQNSDTERAYVQTKIGKRHYKLAFLK